MHGYESLHLPVCVLWGGVGGVNICVYTKGRQEVISVINLEISSRANRVKNGTTQREQEGQIKRQNTQKNEQGVLNIPFSRA